MADLPLTAFDVIVIAVVALSLLMGLARGMIRELVAIASWVAALAVAFYAFDQVRPLVRGFVTPPLLADVIAGGGIFLVALIVFKILGAMLAGGVEAIGLGFVDRLGGLAFGLARGAFLVCAGYLIATMLMRPEELPVWVKEGRLRPQVAEGAAWLRGFLPETIEADTRRAGEAMGRTLGLEREGRESPGTAGPGGESGYPPETRQRLDRLMERVN
jgi:membrane protein required for colicin V production